MRVFNSRRSYCIKHVPKLNIHEQSQIVVIASGDQLGPFVIKDVVIVVKYMKKYDRLSNAVLTCDVDQLAIGQCDQVQYN